LDAEDSVRLTDAEYAALGRGKAATTLCTCPSARLGRCDGNGCSCLKHHVKATPRRGVATKHKRAPSKGEEALAAQLTADGYAYAREYRFAPPRRWRFDFALVGGVAIEVEGGAWTGGRHVRGEGFEADAEKYAEAVARGWRVLRVTTKMALDGRALWYVERALESEAAGAVLMATRG
jgi:very-short-patch-repair endonuclease